MIDAGELRKGSAIELDGEIYQITDYRHIKIGRGSAQVRLRLRDIRSNNTTERSFQASDKFTPAFLEHRSVQYLYSDGIMVGYGKAIYVYFKTVVNYLFQGCTTIRGVTGVNMQIGSYQFAFSRYSPLRVSTLIMSPTLMKRGTWIVMLVSSFAGLLPPVAVSPLKPGSVSVT